MFQKYSRYHDYLIKFYSYLCRSFFSYLLFGYNYNERFILQVEYVMMENEQADAYKEAVQEYRAASLARTEKGSYMNNPFRVFGRRQISNYFIQFRKVLPSTKLIAFQTSTCVLIHLHLCYSYLYCLWFILIMSFLDCKSPFISEALLQWRGCCSFC